MNNVKATKRAKTPTEPSITLADVWNNFDFEYLKFVSWIQNSTDNCQICDIILIDEAPASYRNKWGREQFKMKVFDYNSKEERVLSAGKKLFSKIRKFCLENNCQPYQLHLIISRIGNGFNTDYMIASPND